MERREIIRELKKYFSIKELVCNHTYERFGENSWQFLDTKLLHTILILRTRIFNAPMICNYNGHYQRGLRCNMCSTVKLKTSVYLSAHILGKACDFSINGVSGEEARNLIKRNQDLLPYPVRIEKNVNWLHIDVRDTDNNDNKVIEFYG